jgi:dTDP-4-dehydrorhamnose reductase
VEKSNKTIMILGASGMVGHLVSYYLVDKGYDIITVSRKLFKCGTNINGDLRNNHFLHNILNFINYDIIINCTGILNKECDINKKDAIYINSYLPHILAENCEYKNKKLIHISTDCIFLGEKDGNYNESSIPDGNTNYSFTKILGEIYNKNNLTFRTSIIGPDINQNGIGLINWFMLKDSPLQGYSNHIWTGVTSLCLAKAIDEAINLNINGLYHLVNNDTINKLDLLILLNKYLINNNKEIIPSFGEKNINKSLINTRKDFNFIVPSYENMICELSQYMKNFKNLYPHYNKYMEFNK